MKTRNASCGRKGSLWLIALFVVVAATAKAQTGSPGKVLHELWMNKSGSTLAKVDFSSTPDYIGFKTEVKGASNLSDNYAQRLTCYVTVPKTDAYTFWVAGDNETRLSISLDGDPAHLQPVCSVAGWSRDESYEQFASQKSAVFNLSAGQVLYLELLNKEGTGGDHATGAWSTPSMVRCTISGQYCTAPAPANATLLREKWNNIFGGDVADLTGCANYPNAPDLTTYMTGEFHGPSGIGNHYGTRVRGYFVPSTTGSYEFRVSGDDQTYLYLSTDADPANKVFIASVPTYSGDLQFTKFAQQKSAAISLTAGAKYYIELTQVEGGGLDHYAVAVAPAGGTAAVIPAANLRPLVDEAAPEAPVLTLVHASDQVVRLALAGSDDVGVRAYDVYRDGTLVGRTSTGEFADATVAPSTACSYTARAVDRGGNLSALSAPLAVSVPASPAVPGGGSGLAATYYANKDFTGTRVDRIDPQIDFSWGKASPDPGLGSDIFSVRWMGEVAPAYTEEYKFITYSDDGINLWVDNQLILSNWTNHGTTENVSASVELEAGRRYRIRVEHYDNGGKATARLLWESASQPRVVIPQECLYPSEYLTGAKVAITTPDASIVSPACVEGRVGADATAVSVTVDGGTSFDAVRLDPTSFYADDSSASGTSIGIALKPAAGTQVTVSTGAESAVQTITWTPTDIAASAAVTIRRGDSLLLTAGGAGASLEIDATGDGVYELSGAPGDRFPAQYPAAGVFTAAARIDGVAAGTLTVTVVDTATAPAIGCIVDKTRTKDLPVTPAAAIASVALTPTDVSKVCLPSQVATDAGIRAQLKARATGIGRICSRLGGRTGPIIRLYDTHNFTAGIVIRNYAPIIKSFDDGDVLVGEAVEVSPRFNGHELELKIITGHPVFEDGGKTKWIPISAFDSNAQYTYYIIVDGDWHVCHITGNVREVE